MTGAVEARSRRRHLFDEQRCCHGLGVLGQHGPSGERCGPGHGTPSYILQPRGGHRLGGRAAMPWAPTSLSARMLRRKSPARSLDWVPATGGSADVGDAGLDGPDGITGTDGSCPSDDRAGPTVVTEEASGTPGRPGNPGLDGGDGGNGGSAVGVIYGGAAVSVLSSAVLDSQAVAGAAGIGAPPGSAATAATAATGTHACTTYRAAFSAPEPWRRPPFITAWEIAAAWAGTTARPGEPLDFGEMP